MVFTRKLTQKEKEIIEKIIVFVEDKHNRSEGHDYSHILEVCRLSIEIGKAIKDEVDPFVLICGALLHDIGRINAPNGLFHGLDGGARAEEFLESLIEDKYIINKIERIVVRHTPNSGIPPEAPEEKVVFDADTLERLGFMGMIRGIMGKTGTIESIIAVSYT
ncbi:MAG: HD domain-containing protein, partial [Candidatus Woesearchaeota archaeon]|nr:HD domain-containing protein [Candidatus Woesearchaeota archaeon]